MSLRPYVLVNVVVDVVVVVVLVLVTTEQNPTHVRTDTRRRILTHSLTALQDLAEGPWLILIAFWAWCRMPLYLPLSLVLDPQLFGVQSPGYA